MKQTLLMMGLLFWSLFSGWSAQAEGVAEWRHAQSDDSMPEVIQLQTQKYGISKTFMYRQLQPKKYPLYEDKIQSLYQTLHATYHYLDSLQTQVPDLQRISAFNAETALEWSLVEERVTPEEQAFQSYQLMKEAVTELRLLTQYWIATERVKRYFRGTAADAAQDQAFLSAKREKIRTALAALDKMERFKHNLRSESPYSF